MLIVVYYSAHKSQESVKDLSMLYDNNHYYDKVMEKRKLIDNDKTSNEFNHTRSDSLILVQNFTHNNKVIQNDCDLQTKVLSVKCQGKLLPCVLKNWYNDTKQNNCNKSIPDLQVSAVESVENFSSSNKQSNEIGNGFTEEIKSPNLNSIPLSLVPENQKSDISEISEKINRLSENDDCKSGYQTSSSSINSSSNKMGIIEGESIKCNECGLFFKQLAGLTSHIRTKHNHILPYECNLCGIKQGSKSSSTLHAKWHRIKNSFKCEWCDKVFYKRPLLMNHESRYHSQFRCKTCDNFYKTKELLQKHHVTSHKETKINICNKSNKKIINCTPYQEDLQNEHVEQHLTTLAYGNKSNVVAYNKQYDEMQLQKNKAHTTSPSLTNDRKMQQTCSNEGLLVVSGQLNQTKVHGNEINVNKFEQSCESINLSKYNHIATPNQQDKAKTHINESNTPVFQQLQEPPMSRNNTWISMNKKSVKTQTEKNKNNVATSSLLNKTPLYKREKMKILYKQMNNSLTPYNDPCASISSQSYKTLMHSKETCVSTSSHLKEAKIHQLKMNDTIHDQSNKFPMLLNNSHVNVCEQSNKVQSRTSKVSTYEQLIEVQNLSNQMQGIVSNVSNKRKNHQMHSKTKTHVTQEQNELPTNNTRQNVVMTGLMSNSNKFQPNINVPSLSNMTYTGKIQNALPNKDQTFNTIKYGGTFIKSIKADRLGNKIPSIKSDQQDIQQTPSNKTQVSLSNQLDEMQKSFDLQNKSQTYDNKILLNSQSNKAQTLLPDASCSKKIQTIQPYYNISCNLEIQTQTNNKSISTLDQKNEFSKLYRTVSSTSNKSHVHHTRSNKTNVSISDQDQVVQKCVNESGLSHKAHTLQTRLNKIKTQFALSSQPIESQKHMHYLDNMLSYFQTNHMTSNKMEVGKSCQSNEAHTEADKMSTTLLGVEQHEVLNRLGSKPYITMTSSLNDEKIQQTLDNKMYLAIPEKLDDLVSTQSCIKYTNTLQTHGCKEHISLSSQSKEMQTKSTSCKPKENLSHSHKPDVINSCCLNIMQVPQNETEVSKSSQSIKVQTHFNKMSVTTIDDQQYRVYIHGNIPNFTKFNLSNEEIMQRTLNNEIYISIPDEPNKVASAPPCNFISIPSLETQTPSTFATSQSNDNQSHSHKPDVIVSCLPNEVQTPRNETSVSMFSQSIEMQSHVSNTNVITFNQNNEGEILIDKPTITAANLSNKEKIQQIISNKMHVTMSGQSNEKHLVHPYYDATDLSHEPVLIYNSKINVTISSQPNKTQMASYKPDVIMSCMSDEILTNHSPSLPDIAMFNQQNKTQIRLTCSDEENDTFSDQPNKSLIFQNHRKETSVEKPVCKILNESHTLQTCQTGHTVYGLLNNASYLQMHNKTGYCRLCNKTFVSNKLLLEHFNYLHRLLERAQKCNLCSNVFATRFNFQNHMTFSHMDHKLFVCDLCDEHFVQRHALESHIVLHKERNWHKCPACPKSFMKSSTYKKHLFEHSENPLKCKMCFLKFIRLSDLIKHQRVHKRNHVYLCELCSDLSFLCIKDLQEHVKMFHSNLSVDWTI